MLNKNIYPYWSAAALSTSSPAYKDPVQGCGYVPASLQLLMLAAYRVLSICQTAGSTAAYARNCASALGAVAASYEGNVWTACSAELQAAGVSRLLSICFCVIIISSADGCCLRAVCPRQRLAALAALAAVASMHASHAAAAADAQVAVCSRVLSAHIASDLLSKMGVQGMLRDPVRPGRRPSCGTPHASLVSASCALLVCEPDCVCELDC